MPNTMATANKEAFWKVQVAKLSVGVFHKERLAMKTPWPLLDPMLTLQTRRWSVMPSNLTRALIISHKLRHSVRHESAWYFRLFSWSSKIWPMTNFTVSCWNKCLSAAVLAFSAWPGRYVCRKSKVDEILFCSMSFLAFACPLRRLRSKMSWCSWLNFCWLYSAFILEGSPTSSFGLDLLLAATRTSGWQAWGVESDCFLRRRAGVSNILRISIFAASWLGNTKNNTNLLFLWYWRANYKSNHSAVST